MTQMKDESTQDDEAGKLFVGGLSWETTQEKLSEYFSRFGDVIDCVVMKNNETGRSRGFGFVTFRDTTCVGKILSSGPHELDGRTIDPKVCSARSAQKNKKNSTFPKVFLGGLPPNCTETDVRSFFSRYGTVVEVVLMYDQEKKRARGFGFLSFETEDSVKAVCAEHYVKINGKQVEVKHAEPRDKNQRVTQNTPSNQWGPGGWCPPGGPMGPPGPMGWNWGPQPPYGPQAGWGPHQAGYGPPGYQNWGGHGYGPYSGHGHNYGPGYGPGYSGYGPGYNGPPAPGGPPPPANDGYTGSGGPAPATGGPPNGPPAGPPGGGSGPGAGMGTYQQENSNYGPIRGGYGGGAAGGNASAGGSYNSGSGGGGGGSWNGPAGGPSGGYPSDPYRNAEGNAPPAGGRAGSQSYHPYRR